MSLPETNRRHPEIHYIDVHVGARVRLRRTLLGMSQETLGDAIGLAFQQVQKYERGANRISASMLYQIAEALNVPVAFFFDDLAGADTPVVEDTGRRRATLELNRAYNRLPAHKQNLFLKLAQLLADDEAVAPVAALAAE